MKGHSASRKKLYQQFILLIIATLATISVIAMQSANLPDRSTDAAAEPPTEPALAAPAPTLLSDPFLQLPTDSSVQVVWFTEFEGTGHTVEYGKKLTAKATTIQLSRTREDSDSRVPGRPYAGLSRREIWRHQATIIGLKPGDRLPYRVISRDANGQTATSDIFTLAATPPTGQPLQILLTSDHQLKPLTPANLQKVEETVGRVDAVFFAGDLVDHADRASEWFDDAKGGGFFPSLQGRAQQTLTRGDVATTYTGGALIQHAPIFPAIGNHEVMGRYSDTEPINTQFTNTLPRQLVEQFYPAAADADTERWIKDHSFNTDTYEEIFSLPTAQLSDGRETQAYYAVSFGDVRLVSLYVTQVWRSPALTPDTKGRYREQQNAIEDPKAWGYGQHIFEDIRQGSAQYQWLKQELASEAFQSAKYKIVMLHHPPHTLGGNIVPAFTDPVPVENRAADGTLQSIQYEYPKADDYLIRDLEPLLASADVQLVFYGHSHLWNRFVSPGGMHFLETSNVGNTYGAHLTDPREIPTEAAVKAAGSLPSYSESYVATGDPNGLAPIVPTIAPLTDGSGSALPYLASNDITSFTIFETETGTLSSYYFDTRAPSSAAVKFDEFRLPA